MATPTFRILGARRSYDFAPDAIRLTVLTLPAVVGAIRASFGFTAAQIGTPLPLFGDIPNTIPPGVVFNYGSFLAADGKTVPIRLLHLEPARVVIDVAYSSDVIEPIFQRLREVARQFQAPDGGPSIEGEPQHVRDHSELTFRVAANPLLWLSTAPWQQLVGPLDVDERIIATVALAKVNSRSPLVPISAGAPTVASVELRQGTAPDDGVFYSAAPLRTAEHEAGLRAIIATLLPDAAETP